MRRRPPAAGLLLAAYLALLAVVLFNPSAALGSGGIVTVVHLLADLGVPVTSTLVQRVEFLENVALIVPASFLAVLVWPRWSWRDWTAVGFLGALAVETLQGVLLSGRSATFSDVVANTLGACLGAAAAALIARIWAKPPRRTNPLP